VVILLDMGPILQYLFSWEVFTLGIGITIPMGYVLLTDDFKKFSVARVCFYAALLWIYGKVTMWAVFTHEKLLVRAVLTFLVFGIVGVAFAETLRLANKRETIVNTEQSGQAVEPKKTDIKQKSEGDHSPNTSIIGNNNTVNIGDSKTNTKQLDEIKKDIRKLLQSEQGKQTSPKNLLARYPFGYTIFEIDYTNSVYPYQTHALDEWDFDWSMVTLRKNINIPEIPDTPDTVWIRIPDIRRKGGRGPIRTDNNIGGPKRVGPFGGNLFSDGVITMKAEILAIRESGIVFLIGFTPAARKAS